MTTNLYQCWIGTTIPKSKCYEVRIFWTWIWAATCTVAWIFFFLFCCRFFLFLYSFRKTFLFIVFKLRNGGLIKSMNKKDKKMLSNADRGRRRKMRDSIKTERFKPEDNWCVMNRNVFADQERRNSNLRSNGTKNNPEMNRNWENSNGISVYWRVWTFYFLVFGSLNLTEHVN